MKGKDFKPQELMAERDIEREKLIIDNKLDRMLEREWEYKSKEEKQEFISKFIESMKLIKQSDGKFKIDHIKFRHSFIDELVKFFNSGIFDVYVPVEINDEDIELRMSVNMTQEQLNDYMERISKEFDIEYYQLKKEEIGEDDKLNKIQQIELKKNQKAIRLVAVKDEKKFELNTEKDDQVGLVVRTVE